MTAEDLHSYYCEDCEEWTYLERLEHPGEVHCAYCGVADVNISPADYEKLKEWVKICNESI